MALFSSYLYKSQSNSCGHTQFLMFLCFCISSKHVALHEQHNLKVMHLTFSLKGCPIRFPVKTLYHLLLENSESLFHRFNSRNHGISYSLLNGCYKCWKFNFLKSIPNGCHRPSKLGFKYTFVPQSCDVWHWFHPTHMQPIWSHSSWALAWLAFACVVEKCC